MKLLFLEAIAEMAFIHGDLHVVIDNIMFEHKLKFNLTLISLINHSI